MTIPHLRLSDLLPPDRYEALVHRVGDVAARVGLGPTLLGADPVLAGFTADLGDCWDEVDAAIRAVSGLARLELGLPHFSVDGAAGVLTVYRDDGVLHSIPLGTPGPGSRRIDFVYTCSPDPNTAAGGRLLLYETEDHDGSGSATPSFESINVVDNAVVLFPSVTPHSVVPPKPLRGGIVRYSFEGWLTGEPRPSLPAPH